MSSRGSSARLATALFVAWVMVGGSVVASAQEEEEPIECPSTEIGPLDYTPASQAAGVTLDAYLRVRYSEGYFDGVPDAGDFIRLHRDTNDLPGFVDLGEEVPGAGQLVGDDLYFVPDELLDPDTEYAIVAESFELEPILSDFHTGLTVDTRPPSIFSIDPPTTERVGPACGRGEGYRVDLVVRGVSDDGPPSSVELLVYLARQEGLESPELVLRARGTGNDEIPLGFVLTDDRANDPACVVIHAVDGVGRVDDSQEPVCFEPIQGAFFNGICSAGYLGGGSTGAGGTLMWSLLAVALVARRRRAPSSSTC